MERILGLKALERSLAGPAALLLLPRSFQVQMRGGVLFFLRGCGASRFCWRAAGKADTGSG